MDLLPPANEVWGKVIFLHLSVILFIGWGICLIACWDTAPLGPEAGTPPPGADTPTAVHAERYGQQAGDTHPTGMQSC